jgi:hypothetical protein
MIGKLQISGNMIPHYLYPVPFFNFTIQFTFMKEDKKFKPDAKPFKENRICSFYKVTDENGQRFYAKFFLEKKLE